MTMEIEKMDKKAKPETETFKRSVFNQFLLGVLVNFSTIAPSMSLGFSAVTLPILTNKDNPYQLTQDQGSWFASMASLTTPIGCLLAGPIADKYGRRIAIIWINILGLVGWVIIAIAYYVPEHQYSILLLGRVFTGLSTGLSSIPASIYMAEIASVKLIGVFTAWSSVTFNLGVFVVYALGWFLKSYWGTISVITAAFPCLGLICTIFFVPESPTWLVSKSRYDEAVVKMCKIWGSKDVIPEIKSAVDILIKNKAKSNIGGKSKKTFKTKLINKYRYLIRPTCWKPFLILIVLFFAQQFSGIFSIVFYAIDVCQGAGIDMDPYAAITLIGLVRVLAAMIASMVNRKVGKKPLTIISGTGIMVSMIGLGAYVTLKKNGQIIGDELDYVPLILLFTYFILGTVGFLIVPFALSAEVYPVKIRGVASALTGCFGYFFNFIAVKIFMTMMNSVGIQGIFYFYGSVAAFGTVFAILAVPETRNKTIEEISEYFQGGKKSKPSLLAERV